MLRLWCLGPQRGGICVHLLGCVGVDLIAMQVMGHACTVHGWHVCQDGQRLGRWRTGCMRQR
jgi:hypothetical protein